jgi:hypothetical protein
MYKISKFFKKINLQKGLTYENLVKETNNIIKKKYKKFINEPEEMIEIKTSLIFITIYNILNKKIFESKKSNDRVINSKEISEQIDVIIQKYEKVENIYFELFKQHVITINNFPKNCDDIINNILNNVTKISNKEKKMICFELTFFIYLINNFKDIINTETYKNIKLYIINQLVFGYQKKFKCYEDAKKHIDNTRSIIYNYKYPIGYSLIKLIDENFKAKEIGRKFGYIETNKITGLVSVNDEVTGTKLLNDKNIYTQTKRPTKKSKKSESETEESENENPKFKTNKNTQNKPITKKPTKKFLKKVESSESE